MEGSQADVVANQYNLDLRNPNRPDDLAHRPPDELVAELIDTERELLGVLEDLQREIKDFSARKPEWSVLTKWQTYRRTPPRWLAMSHMRWAAC